jgi:hypothetical protein
MCTRVDIAGKTHKNKIKIYLQQKFKFIYNNAFYRTVETCRGYTNSMFRIF